MIRRAAVAGAFYPDNPGILSEMIEGFLKEAPLASLPKKARLCGLVVPHAGYIYSGVVVAAGYKLISNIKLIASQRFPSEMQTSKVILIGPSHQVAFAGAVIDENDFWETPLGKVKLEKLGKLDKWGEVHRYEHSLEVQVPFLQKVLKNFTICPILTGEVEPEELAGELLEVFGELKNFLIIVSSDLSHYYPYEMAVKLDRVANEAIPNLDIETVEKKVEACGKTGILTVMHLAKMLGWKGKFLDYKNSGDTAGDKASVVGYGAYAFYEISNLKCQSIRQAQD